MKAIAFGAIERSSNLLKCKVGSSGECLIADQKHLVLSHCSLKKFLSSTLCFHSKQECLKQKLIKLNGENDTTLSTYRNQLAGSCTGNERKCFWHRASYMCHTTNTVEALVMYEEESNFWMGTNVYKIFVSTWIGGLFLLS